MNLKELIDRKLDEYLPKESEEPKCLHKALRYSVFSGGKRLRPILAIESAKACGGHLKDVMPAACAIELVHTYSLIHDDLPSMDDDDYRRGKKACHVVFGEANAILAGDALLTLAFNIIAEGLEPKTGMKVIKELSAAVGSQGMVGGQALDLETNRKKDLVKVNRLKTAKLFKASAKIGAITAHAGEKKTNALASYGVNLGMAFQIADDIIDRGDYAKIFGMEKARSDLRNLIKKAKDHLKVFGRPETVLLEMADRILDRTAE